jgi:putative membrane protein
MTPALRRWYDALLLAFLVSVITRRAFLGGEVSLTGTIVLVQGGIVLALTWLHACAREGLLRAFQLLAITLTLSFGAEWLGASRGWIFGSYDYGTLLGTHIAGEVPILIPLAWYVLAYLADALASLSLPQSASWGRVAYAALALTAWDFLFDPICVSLGAWTWEGGGAYFGYIPLSNFGGWYLVSFIIFALYRLWAPSHQKHEREDRFARLDPLRFGAPIPLYFGLTALMVLFAVQLELMAEALVGAAAALPIIILASHGYMVRVGCFQRDIATTK